MTRKASEKDVLEAAKMQLATLAKVTTAEQLRRAEAVVLCLAFGLTGESDARRKRWLSGAILQISEGRRHSGRWRNQAGTKRTPRDKHRAGLGLHSPTSSQLGQTGPGQAASTGRCGRARGMKKELSDLLTEISRNAQTPVPSA